MERGYSRRMILENMALVALPILIYGAGRELVQEFRSSSISNNAEVGRATRKNDLYFAEYRGRIFQVDKTHTVEVVGYNEINRLKVNGTSIPELVTKANKGKSSEEIEYARQLTELLYENRLLDSLKDGQVVTFPNKSRSEKRVVSEVSVIPVASVRSDVKSLESLIK